ncbi:acyl-CoA dehydrogenase [Streptomyces sp. NPDC046876]|uniref:acyl-CoA dehydrogenase n=1 Tax=Streptomyces sp. NPDC046876 TaxID=3155616 RepID=UPI0033E8F161
MRVPQAPRPAAPAHTPAAAADPARPHGPRTAAAPGTMDAPGTVDAYPAAATAQAAQAAADERVARLEALLGDPADPANPVGHDALLAADRRAVPSADGEALLDGFGMNREYVPTSLGGRFDSAETLLRLMRPVFRRDVALGAGYGMTSFMAANDVWMHGSRAQRDWLAGRMLAGSRAAIAQHETAHTNDLVRSQVRAAPAPSGGWTVTGSKPVVLNLHRADALVLFARTDDRPGSTAAHSALLLDPHTLPADRYRVTRRPPALGLRGCFFAGVELDACPVPDHALLGAAGTGVVTALRSFQVSRTLMASLSAAAVDTALRTAVLVDHSQGPGRAGRAPVDPQHTAATLTGAFTDLLMYDCLAVATTRALHLLPAETSVYSSAVKALLPRILSGTMYDLTTVLGSEVYTREGTVGIFQKHVRDVPVVSLGHAGTVACQATIIPQLTALAGNSWFRTAEAPAELFRPGAPLPAFDSAALALAGGRDSLSATLAETAALSFGTSPAERTLHTLAGRLCAELAELRARVLALPPPDSGTAVGPAWFALTDRYVLVLAAAAVLGVWRHNRGGPDPFLADPSWAAAALHRLARRLGTPVPELPAECTARVHQEVLARFGDRRSFDLYNTPLAG